MAFQITSNALAASQGTSINPQLVFEIDGVSNVFGAIDVKEVLKIGDFDFGDGSLIGELVSVTGQKPYISFQAGTTTKIKQSLRVDKGLGESISTMNIAVIDKDEFLTQNILPPDDSVSPTFDILGQRAKVWLGFEGTSFPEDFIIVFRGVIDDVTSGAGIVTFQVNHPDSRKKGEIFQPGETELSSGISAGATVIPVDSTTDFLDPTHTGPDGTIDPDLAYYVRINDEVIRYETATGVQFQTLTRAQFGTTAAAHSLDDSVESFYVIGGASGGANTIDVALKLMLSGKDGPYKEDFGVTNFVRISPSETVANSIFFQDEDITQGLNVVVGDFITTTGASNGANNVTLKAITGITIVSNGSYIVVGGVTFVEENDSAAVIDFRSQYDVWPSGAEMENQDVDINEHLSLKATFLSNQNDYRFFIREDAIELKTFLAEQVYNPQGAFSVPRKSQSSVGFHLAGLLPGGSVPQLNASNILNPSKLKIKRSTSQNFFNTVTYRYEESALEKGKFFKINSTLNTDSRDRIQGVGIRNLKIDALGLRDDLNGDGLSTSATTRRLNKYKFGAEFLKGVQINFKTGFTIEVGDIVSFDLGALKITDISDASRDGNPRLFQVTNKILDIKRGKVTLDIVDTNFENAVRFGLVSPASFVKSGSSTTEFIIEASFNTTAFGTNEFLKWTDFVGAGVRIHSVDNVTSGTSLITAIAGNAITVAPALAFTPLAGYLMEFSDYDNQPENVKLLYVFMRDSAFADGKAVYQMI